ncbi:MAG TPA: hypothetical protein VGX23_14140 [Actinocrinis sp.]|nr:hypothetical protein [Actinocrinis sp.]
MTDPNNAPEHDPDQPDTTPAGDAETQTTAILADLDATAQLKKLDAGKTAESTTKKTDTSTDTDTGKGPSQATRLVELAHREYRTVRGTDGRTYAVLTADGAAYTAQSLRGENGLRMRLAHQYYTETQSAPSAGALADALTILEGQAMDTPPEPVALRVARHDGNLILDLARPDGKCVIISPGQWHLEPVSPVLFRRTNLTSPLPDPVRNPLHGPNGLDGLRELLNVSESGFRLLVAWLITALFPDVAHPILTLTGEQGTAKSTAERLLVSLIDPSPAPLRTAPKDQDAWTVQAAASWAVMLDNISTIPPWFSDALCKAVTGDGMVKRALYTDDDVSVVSFRRAIGMNTIDAGALRGDLAERMLLVELDPIPEDERRTESEVNALFDQARPAVMGALFDLAAKVLKVLPDVRVQRLPRLADFALILAALDQAAEWDTLADFFAIAAELTETVIETDPFAEAVRKHAQTNTTWTGTAAALLELLTPAENVPKTFPRTPRAVSGHLRRVAPALRKSGTEVEFQRENTSRTIRLTHTMRDDGK